MAVTCKICLWTIYTFNMIQCWSNIYIPLSIELAFINVYAVARANDFPRSQKTDGIRGIYPVKWNCIQTGISFYESKSSYFTLFFINFNPYPVLELRHIRCLHVIAAFSRFGNLLQWRHSARPFFSNFYFRQLFPLTLVKYAWVRFRYTTHAQTLCKWAGACRKRPRTPESQHVWYDLMLGERWLRWLGKWR